MGKNKLSKFAEMEELDCVFQPDIDFGDKSVFPLKGKWGSDHFKNDNPVVLELGCGKGEYTVGLAKAYPDKNFVGIDIKGARIWKGAKRVQEEGIPNAAFIRTRVDFIDYFFGEDEVNEIWLTFSDPQAKKPRKRLTAPPFIDRYKKILSNDGVIHLKTDSDLLFEYTLEEIDRCGYDKEVESWDIYGELDTFDDETAKVLQIRTFYESMWLEEGKTIKYCRFKP